MLLPPVFTFIYLVGLILPDDHPHRLETAQQAVEPARVVDPGHSHRQAVRHLRYRTVTTNRARYSTVTTNRSSVQHSLDQ